MAQTWRGSTAKQGNAAEGPLSYSLRGGEYRVESKSLGSVTAPIERVVGGQRHGLSLLARLTEIGGEKLARPVLIETRYLFSTPHGKLELSPGFSKETPTSWETAFGRVLAPEFEKRCLSCHGAPLPGLSQTGVRCENCHGPGEAHASAKSSIANPVKLSKSDQVQLCAQCHADERPLADPLPADLLISHQVEAITHSECYIQSGAGLSCTDCHNPHKDEPDTVARSEKICLGCHRGACPVNQKSGCVGCHMPSTQKDTFRMVDHWIRVTEGAGGSHKPVVPPKREFLRLIAMDDRQQAEDVRKQIAAGGSFFELARKHSTGPAALSGGYLGNVEPERMDPKLGAAALRLGYGETSEVVESGGHFAILQRMPRDFRWRASDLFREAESLKAKGQVQEAANKCQQALQIYPHLLRALVLLGGLAGEQGNASRAAAILEYANRLYPEDAGALFNLGIAYGAAGRAEDEMRAYERAIEIDPDLTPAFLNLGAALFAAGKFDGAAAAFQRGLQTNPLSARLYYNLALVRERQGQMEEARRLRRVVAKIAPGQF